MEGEEVERVVEEGGGELLTHRVRRMDYVFIFPHRHSR